MFNLATQETASGRTTKKPAKRKQQTETFVTLGQHDWPTERRVFIAAGSAAEVAKLVRQAKYWSGDSLITIAKGRVDQRQLRRIKETISCARVRCHWYELTDEIGALADRYCVWPLDDAAGQ